MPSRDVVIETDPDGSLVRWGIRTETRGPKAHVVRWTSGEETEVALGRQGDNQLQVVNPDGLAALASIRPDYVAELISDDPVAVFVRAILDLARPVAAKEIKIHVRKHLGLRHPEFDVDKAWTRYRARILAVEGINCPKSGENSSKFSAGQLLSLTPVLDFSAFLGSGAPPADAEASPSASEVASAPAVEVTETVLADVTDSAAEAGAAAEAAGSAETEPEPETALEQEAAQAHELRTPWALHAAEVDGWVTETTEALTEASDLLKTSHTVTVADWFTSPLEDDAEPVSVAAATALLGLSHRLGDVANTEAALRAATAALEADPGALQRDPVLSATASDAAATLPFQHGSVREVFVAVLVRCAPEVATDTAWWSGIDARALARLLGDGVPPEVVDGIREAVIAPAAQKAARQATTRTHLAELVHAPADLVSAIRPDLLGRAWRHVASSDPVAALMLAQVDNHADLAAARDRIRQLEAAASAGQERIGALEAKLEDAEARVAAVLERTARARGEKRERRASAETGIRQELALMTAEFLAFLDSELGVASDEAIRARMSTLSAKQFLEPVGRVGEVTGFEPERHKLMGGAVATGEPVIVRRCGYTWVAGEDPAIALQALVEPHRDE